MKLDPDSHPLCFVFRLISFGEECGLEDDGKDGDRKKDANVGSMSNLFEDKERDGKSGKSSRMCGLVKLVHW